MSRGAVLGVAPDISLFIGGGCQAAFAPGLARSGGLGQQMENGREKAQKAQKTKKNLTQSRLRPISPFSFVGQGRKGAKVRKCGA